MEFSTPTTNVMMTVIAFKKRARINKSQQNLKQPFHVVVGLMNAALATSK